GTVMPGNTFAADGVVFWSVSGPNAAIPGQIITLANVQPRLMVLGNSGNISAPNFAAASGVFNSDGPNDVLMRFSGPVKSARLVTDDTPEGPNVVRLFALDLVGGNQFVVRAVDSALDDAVSAPD